jgi:hypothetical protein
MTYIAIIYRSDEHPDFIGLDYAPCWRRIRKALRRYHPTRITRRKGRLPKSCL